MALKGRIRFIDEKLLAVVVVYVEGLQYEAERYDLLKNESSLSIDWLPMSHDVVETSRRPPTLRSVHFVDVGDHTSAIVVELSFDVLNMKLRSTYEIRINSLYDRHCNQFVHLSSHAAMNVTFACERIIGADCTGALKIDHHAVCNFMRSYHTRVIENPKLEKHEIDVIIAIEKRDERYKKLKYFIAYYGPCETSSLNNDIGECILDLQKAEVKRLCVPNKLNCSYDRSFSLTIVNFDTNNKYGVQLCGVIDRRLEQPPLVDGVSKVMADMLAVSAATTSMSVSSVNTLLRTLIGYAFVIAFLLVVLSIFVIYKCSTGKFRCRVHEKNVDQYVIDDSSLKLFEDSVIGAGRFSNVYLGQLSTDWHGPVVLDDQQRVAVKSNRHMGKNEKRLFIDEIEGSKVVGRHSRIVAFIGTVVLNGSLLHVMEYCGNGNLLDYLVSRRKYMVELQENGIDLNGSLASITEINFDAVISVHDLHRIASQICSGMAYLSSKSIVHNALCSRHVLMTLDHNVKISDFGFVSTPNTPTCTPVDGLQKWNALELLRGETSTSLSDSWSFGVVLWEIFTMGGRPYYNIPDEAIRGLIEKGFRLQKPDNCSIQLYQLMRECWFDQPSDRPQFQQMQTRLTTLAQQRSPESMNFMTISTLCDYYIEDQNSTKVNTNIRKGSHNDPDVNDAAAMISESERLLGFRF
ncbi:unnamed protein product [Caenorhabditis bovis]|uniref:Protein kinase domain-containing protein n=1 Tax=Caenorhabditis bovis TaxID=2654633 RepID=A0A8S1E8T5_9PELO|nr:unnamed protein product [Caenorhabditis bovis]